MNRQSHCKHSWTEDTMPNHNRMINKEDKRKENSGLQDPGDQMEVTAMYVNETGDRKGEANGGFREKTHSEYKTHGDSE